MITTEDAKANISRNIQRLLVERGMSAYRLAKLTAEPQNSIYRIVRGDNEPGAVLLARIAEALDVTADDLLYDSKKPRKSA